MASDTNYSHSPISTGLSRSSVTLITGLTGIYTLTQGYAVTFTTRMAMHLQVDYFARVKLDDLVIR